MKFPIGGKVREQFFAGFGEIPKPTVIVWIEEDSFLYIFVYIILYCIFCPEKVFSQDFLLLRYKNMYI